MFQANVLADSVSPAGVRLTTLEVEYPHAVHKDIMTHRMLSRNFQSFRAFPPEKVIENILADPFIPEWGKRTTGMGQAGLLKDQAEATRLWMLHVANCIEAARRFIKLDVAKQQTNFVLQDLTWIRGIITATEWDNFFALRAFAPEGAKPRPEVERDQLADVGLAETLMSNGHVSPFEHQATALNLFYTDEIPYKGNFRGWHQQRKEIPNESNFAEIYGGEFHPYWREAA
jgi:hypothetical protein